MILNNRQVRGSIRFTLVAGIAILIAVVSISVACIIIPIVNGSSSLINTSPPIAAITGTYVGKSIFVTEELMLFTDGNYEQSIVYKGNAKRQSSRGKWTYIDGLITFDVNFIVPLDDKGLINPIHGTDGLPAEIWLGKTYLGVEKIRDHTFYKKL